MSTEHRLKLLRMMKDAEKTNEALLAIAKEKEPTKEPEKVLEDLMAKLGADVGLQQEDYKTKLDAMARDMGADHFNATRPNPDFQNIFDKWIKDFTERAYRKMIAAIEEWTGGKVTADQVNGLLQSAALAQQLAMEMGVEKQQTPSGLIVPGR